MGMLDFIKVRIKSYRPRVPSWLSCWPTMCPGTTCFNFWRLRLLICGMGIKKKKKNPWRGIQKKELGLLNQAFLGWIPPQALTSDMNGCKSHFFLSFSSLIWEMEGILAEPGERRGRKGPTWTCRPHCPPAAAQLTFGPVGLRLQGPVWARG